MKQILNALAGVDEIEQQIGRVAREASAFDGSLDGPTLEFVELTKRAQKSVSELQEARKHFAEALAVVDGDLTKISKSFAAIRGAR